MWGSLKPEIHKKIQGNFLCFYQRSFGELVVSEIEITDINIEIIRSI